MMTVHLLIDRYNTLLGEPEVEIGIDGAGPGWAPAKQNVPDGYCMFRGVPIMPTGNNVHVHMQVPKTGASGQLPRLVRMGGLQAIAPNPGLEVFIKVTPSAIPSFPLCGS